MSKAPVYVDHRGWKYRVMPGISNHLYKILYHKPIYPDNVCWHTYAKIPWRETFEESQADLDSLARRKNWSIEK